MKPLSYGLAQACETAVHPTCKCRCGGLLHGIARGKHLTELPEDDPHFVHPELAQQQGDLFEDFGPATTSASR